MDVLLKKFFETERWEEVINIALDKRIDMGELRKLTSPEVRIALYKAITQEAH